MTMTLEDGSELGEEPSRENLMELFSQPGNDSIGTPVANDEDEEQDDFVAVVDEDGVDKVHAGQADVSVYVFDVHRGDAPVKNPFYRASIGDGDKFTTKVFFNPEVRN